MSPLRRLVLGPRMGLLCAALLLFVPEQVSGQTQDVLPGVPGLPGMRGVFPNCCTEVSDRPIGERIHSCFYHDDRTFPDCRVLAFIFQTVSGRDYCVDLSAPWLHGRLQLLYQNNINCKPLGQ